MPNWSARVSLGRWLCSRSRAVPPTRHLFNKSVLKTFRAILVCAILVKVSLHQLDHDQTPRVTAGKRLYPSITWDILVGAQWMICATLLCQSIQTVPHPLLRCVAPAVPWSTSNWVIKWSNAKPAVFIKRTSHTLKASYLQPKTLHRFKDNVFLLAAAVSPPSYRSHPIFGWWPAAVEGCGRP